MTLSNLCLDFGSLKLMIKKRKWMPNVKLRVASKIFATLDDHTENEPYGGATWANEAVAGNG